MRLSKGFTLVELLVAMAIIGVLVVLLLLAVQSVRETARRAQCMNNLKQLALAAIQHHDRHGTLPPLGVLPLPEKVTDRLWLNPCPPKVNTIISSHSWRSIVLPLMEQQRVHDQIRFDLQIWDEANQPALQSVISTFICPSVTNESWDGRIEFPETDSSGTDQMKIVMVGEPIQSSSRHVVPGLVVFKKKNLLEWHMNLRAARNDYEANVPGSGWMSTTGERREEFYGPWGAWIANIARTPFPKDRLGSLAEVTDGLSSTVLLIEQAGQPDHWTNNWPWHNRFVPFASSGWANGNDGRWAVEPHCGGTVTAPINFDDPWVVNSPNFETNNFNAFSFHGNGANMALCDGSVRYFGEGFDRAVYVALLTRAAGDVVPGEILR